MNRSTWLLIAFNTLVACTAFAGVVSGNHEPLTIAATLGLVAAVVNSAALLRRRDLSPVRVAPPASTEIDVHTVLDLDARLEALELAQADAAEAARWRSLVASGQATAPGADVATDAPAAPGQQAERA